MTWQLQYIYWQNGYKEEAEYYFNEQIKYNNRTNELKRSWGKKIYTHIMILQVYMLSGERKIKHIGI